MIKPILSWLKRAALAVMLLLPLAAAAQTSDKPFSNEQLDQMLAQDAPGPTNKKITYSPYPAKTFPNRGYFGDTHLHTSYSADAGMAGAIVGPEDAYRFDRGEVVKSPQRRVE